MEQFTCSSSSSSFSSSSSSYPQEDHDYHRQVIRSSSTNQPSYLNSLHSVRKPLPKPMAKKFIAPLPPTPPKVYKVDSCNFKEVVRKLTSTPEFQYPSTRRLRDVAPPPLNLSSSPRQFLFPNPNVVAPLQPPPQQGGGGGGGGGEMLSPLTAFTLSPDFCNFLNETLETSKFPSNLKSPGDYFGALSPLGLSLSPTPSAFHQLMSQETVVNDAAKPAKFFQDYSLGGALTSPLGFNLSPSSMSWCSSALLSPGTLSALNRSPVL